MKIKGDMSMKIRIYKNPNGDSRTAKPDVTFEEFHDANKSHRDEVMLLMRELSRDIEDRGLMHDVTKETNEQQFFADLKMAQAGAIDFTEGEWYKAHVSAERHHLNAKCPKDVNLIDVLEMIADVVAAELARKEDGATAISEDLIPNDILKKAVVNTARMLRDRCEVVDDSIYYGKYVRTKPTHRTEGSYYYGSDR